MIYGQDVSNWQGAYKWPGGLTFGFAKATEGVTYADPQFAHNWSALKSKKMIRGAYHFAHTNNNATTEAKHFLAVVKARGLETGDLLALDLEVTDGQSGSHIASWAKTWLEYVKKETGRTPLLYTFRSFASSYCSGLGGYPLWIADPTTAGHPRLAGPWKSWVIHQYSTASGIDHDCSNLTADQLHALGGGVAPAPSPDPEEDTMGTFLNIDRSPTAAKLHAPKGVWTNLKFDRQWEPSVKGNKRGGDWAVIVGDDSHAYYVQGDAIAHLSAAVTGKVRTAQYTSKDYKEHEANPEVGFSGSEIQFSLHAGVAQACHRYVQIMPDQDVDVVYDSFMGFFEKQ